MPETTPVPPGPPPSGQRLRVLLTTEGTYPHTLGGVSTWCQSLIESMPEVDFTVFAHMTSPFVPEVYDRPSNCDLVGVPIWGVEEPAEFNPKMSPRRVLVLSALMNEATARDRFCPLLRELLEMIFEPKRYDAQRFGQLIEAMYRYFREHDYRGTFRTRAVWETFRDVALVSYGVDPLAEEWEDVDPEGEPSPQEIMQRFGQLRRPPAAGDDQLLRSHRIPRLFEATESMRVLYRLLTPLNYEIPDADVVHATAASFCGIAGIVSKIQKGTPLLVTEHGVFMREQMLFLGRIGFPFHLRKFFIQFVGAVSRAVYHYADQVSPVCAYNARWELKNGATPDRIRIIYNGVDPERFRPRAQQTSDRPTVVLVARVDALKDLETALRVADRVRQSIPDVRFRHFGPDPDAEYANRCKALWEQLGLQDTFEWMGSTNDPVGAYNQGDIVLLTSISEAFPYTVIEGMMCGKPVVSTNVGGVPEAVDDLGITARIRDVEGLADGVVSLLRENDQQRRERSLACRERTLELFTIDRSIGEYRTSYAELAAGERPASAPVLPLPQVEPTPVTVDVPAAEVDDVAAAPAVDAPAASVPAASPAPVAATAPVIATATADTAADVRLLLSSPQAERRLTAVKAARQQLQLAEAVRSLTSALRSDPDPAVRMAAGAELNELLGVREEAG